MNTKTLKTAIETLRSSIQQDVDFIEEMNKMLNEKREALKELTKQLGKTKEEG